MTMLNEARASVALDGDTHCESDSWPPLSGMVAPMGPLAAAFYRAAVTAERDAALAQLAAIRWAMGGGDATPARG